MASVPIYKEQINTDAPGVPTPQLPGLPQAASGTGIAQAAGKIGEQVQNAGTELGHHLAYMQRLEQQEDVYNRASGFAQDQELFLRGDGTNDNIGALNRHGGDAKGLIEEFQKNDAKLREKYGKELSPYMQRGLNRLLDTHYRSGFNSIVSHQAKEFRVAQEHSKNAQIKALANTGAGAANTDDLLHSFDAANEINRQFHQEGGASDAELDTKALDLADMFADSSVRSNLEHDPEKAQSFLDALGSKVSERKKEELQTKIDGKMLDLRRGVMWDHVKSFRHEDGTIDLSKAMQTARGLLDRSKVPEGQKQHIIDFVKTQASAADSELRDARESQNRAFVNDSLKAKQSGLSFEQASDDLFKKGGYGFDPKDRQAKQEQLLALYTKDESFYDRAMAHQTPAQKLMWDQIDKMAKAKYGTNTVQLPGDESGANVKAADAFMIEMKHQLMGKPPEQMWAYAQSMLKDVVTQPHTFWFDEKKPAWQIQSDVRTLKNEKMVALETRYGDSAVAQTRAYLVQQGNRNPSAEQIKGLIEQVNRGR